MRVILNMALPPLLFCAALAAHGGQYRGPGGVVPPSKSTTGGNNSSSLPAGGSQPPGQAAPSGPGAVSANAPPGSSGGVSASGTAPRGAPIDDDLTRWEFWWEFGKDPYLRLREAIYGPPSVGSDDALLNPRLAHRARSVLRPADGDLANVAESLVGILRQAKDRDTVSACLIALAKIGRNGAGWDLRTELLPFLAGNDQELRETAALSLGISGVTTRENIDLLLDLARDTELGRKASAHAAVNERTRAFATFGLGLLLQRSRDAGLSRRIVEGLLTVLAQPDSVGRELKVAVLEALALFPGTWQGTAPKVLREIVSDAMGSYYRRNLGPGEQLVQAHVPPAIAQLVCGDAAQAEIWKGTLAADLAAGMDETRGDATGKVNPHIAQSCALALGTLASPWVDATSKDDALCRLLLRAYHDHADQQTRSFALLALGRIGGAEARKTLLHEFETAKRALEQPWVAMALGVYAAKELSAATAAGSTPEVDVAIAAALRGALQTNRNPDSLGALAVALGLCQDTSAADTLRDALRDNLKRDNLAGYLCLGLGLMADDRATGAIRDLMHNAERRPQVLLQTARALGLLGDHTVVPDLCRQIEGQDQGLARLSALASALGQIGDRRSLEPLLRMAVSSELTPLTRAFAVVALGSICDKDPLPWNAAYASTTNYRAATATLTDGAAGILDIL